MRAIKTEITRLNDSIDAKDKIIEELQVRVRVGVDLIKLIKSLIKSSIKSI